MCVVVCPIGEADIPGFHAVLDTVARERKYLAMLQAPSFENTEAFVLRNISEGRPQFVALQGPDENVIGWCDALAGSYEINAHVATLGMGVHPDWRGRGVGKALIGETLAAARDKGLARVQLSVFAENEPALKLYRSCGFVEEGVRRRALRVDGVDHDEILMGLLLA